MSGVETPESDPDRALVERAQAELPYGTTAYNELVRRHTARVYGRAYRILRSSADAEEATQDVFLSVFRNLPRFRFEKPFVHWLNTVTLNEGTFEPSAVVEVLRIDATHTGLADGELAGVRKVVKAQ